MRQLQVSVTVDQYTRQHSPGGRKCMTPSLSVCQQCGGFVLGGCSQQSCGHRRDLERRVLVDGDGDSGFTSRIKFVFSPL